MRFISCKPVIISTNLGVEDLQDQYSDRVASRIVANYKLVNLIGEDIRWQIINEKKSNLTN